MPLEALTPLDGVPEAALTPEPRWGREREREREGERERERERERETVRMGAKRERENEGWTANVKENPDLTRESEDFGRRVFKSGKPRRIVAEVFNT